MTITVTGWKSKDETETGETRQANCEQLASGHVWGLLAQGHKTILVSVLNSEGKVDFE